MRYVSGFLYSLGVVGHLGVSLDALMVGACVFTGTITFAFALEGIVTDIIYKAGKDTNGSVP